MTIAYTLDISSSSPLNFLRVLKKWKGSVWKSVGVELIVWLIFYFSIAAIYRKFLTPEAQRIFENFAYYCRSGVVDIPLTFMLGFFVNLVIQRWTDAFKNMGYLENQAIHISSMILGKDDEARLLRRTIARYLCLAQVLVFRDVSARVRKRFPTYESVVKAGFLLEHELHKIDSYRLDYVKYWVPINWAFALVIKARKEGKIFAENYAVKICDEIRSFRDNLQMLCNYDWVEIPLVYPQVVFLAVHTYFIICLFGRQFITRPGSPNKSQMDFFVPYMTILQYIFFVGWMKVAEGLLNPFGEDDDDFECNFLIDKNFATCLCIVDDAHDDLPPLQKDQFWHKKDVDAIYSEESALLPIHPLIGSAARAASVKEKKEEPEMTVINRSENETKGKSPTKGSSKFKSLGIIVREFSSNRRRRGGSPVKEQHNVTLQLEEGTHQRQILEPVPEESTINDQEVKKSKISQKAIQAELPDTTGAIDRPNTLVTRVDVTQEKP